jgi:hypothetical protein
MVFQHSTKQRECSSNEWGDSSVVVWQLIRDAYKLRKLKLNLTHPRNQTCAGRRTVVSGFGELS